MSQLIEERLSQAIYRAMPAKATYAQKQAVDLAARAVVQPHIQKLIAEANELDVVVGRLSQQVAMLLAVQLALLKNLPLTKGRGVLCG